MVVSSQVSRIKRTPIFFFHSFSSYRLRFRYPNSTPLLLRTIFSTAQLENLWYEKVKGLFTWNKVKPEVQPTPQTNFDDKQGVSIGNKTALESKPTPEIPTMEKVKEVFTENKPEPVRKFTPQTSTLGDKQAVSTGIETLQVPKPTPETPPLVKMKENKPQPERKPIPQKSTMEKMKDAIKAKVPLPNAQFLLSNFADLLKYTRKGQNLRSFLPGQTLDATQAALLEQQENIFRYLAVFDNTGENIQSKQKLDAARHCDCTLSDVENAMFRFSVCKKAEGKLRKMKEEGKPMPTSMDEMQKLMGDPAALRREHNLGQNDPCPCGSRMIYKWCCGKTKVK